VHSSYNFCFVFQGYVYGFHCLDEAKATYRSGMRMKIHRENIKAKRLAAKSIKGQTAPKKGKTAHKDKKGKTHHENKPKK